MKKRMIALLLVFVMAMLSACGKSANQSGKNEDVTQAPMDDNGGSTATEAPTGTPDAEPTDAPASDGEIVGGDWRTHSSYSDDYVIAEGFSVCFSPLDNKAGYAVYNSADGSRVGTLEAQDVVAEGFVTNDINGDGFNDVTIIDGSFSYIYVYADKPWIEGVGGGCFEFYASGSDGPEDGGEDDYTVDALGNTPDVYDFNYGVGESYIRTVTDYGDYFVVTFDTMYQIRVDYQELADVKVGDTVYVMDKPVTVTDILTMDDDYNYTVKHDSAAEAGIEARIIVLPENLSDFYSADVIEDNDFNENPDYASFGFVYCDESYFAYSDWAWDDCYAPMTYCAMYGANFVVTDDTKVRPAYYDMETLGYDFTMSGTEYLRLMDDKEEQEKRSISIFDGIGYKIYPKYDGDSCTGELEEMNGIYTP